MSKQSERPHIEFFAVPETGWTIPPGYPETITQHIIVDTLDTQQRTGERVLLMRFAPGAITGDEPIRHAECEDVFVYSGDLIVYGAEDATGQRSRTRFDAPAYATRPGDVPHGPFGSDTGCLMLVRFCFPA
ncbi:MAG: cupin [Pseudomonadota bacterium]